MENRLRRLCITSRLKPTARSESGPVFRKQKASPLFLPQIGAEIRDLFRRPLLPAELARFDLVVLDPPRPGALAQAKALAESGVPKVLYVSCNAASFARDARLLVDGGYRLNRVRPLDQFLWSPHVELFGEFSR